ELLGELVSFPGAKNPLFLKVVLSELRLFGAFAGLQEQVRAAYGETPEDAFRGLLNRMEADSAGLELDPAAGVRLLFGALAHARRGLSDDEIAQLIVSACARSDDAPGGEPHDSSRVDRPRALDAIQVYLRQVRPFMARRQGSNDFYYQSMRSAAASWSV